MLEVKDIDVCYGDVQVLRGVSLSVGEGEIVGLVGANGAGKSTTLKAISGLIPLRNGSMQFDGVRLDGVPAHKVVELGISHVPEGRRLFPYLTVKENLEVGALIPRAKKVRKESLEQVFSLFPVLRERSQQLAGTLSGGEQQMLAIARGLMSRPRLLMLDEPSLGLAPLFVKKIFELVETIRQQGISIFLVEQNVKHCLEVVNRAYVLENGRVVLHGSGKELLESDSVRQAYLGI